MVTEPVQSRLSLRRCDAAKVLGISPRLLWQLTKDGAIRCVRVGKGKRQIVLYSVADLQHFLSQKPEAVQEGDNE